MSDRFKKKGALVKTIAAATSKTQNLDQDEIKDEELRQAFKLFDTSGDGYICADELEGAMRCLGMNPCKKEIQEMIDEVDMNDDRKLEFNEFKKAMMSKCRLSIEKQREELEEAFSEFDVSGDGYLDKSEFQALMKEYGEDMSDEEIEEMINELKDSDPDGEEKICVKAFVERFCQFARMGSGGEVQADEQEEAY